MKKVITTAVLSTLCFSALNAQTISLGVGTQGGEFGYRYDFDDKLSLEAGLSHFNFSKDLRLKGDFENDKSNVKINFTNLKLGVSYFPFDNGFFLQAGILAGSNTIKGSATKDLTKEFSVNNDTYALTTTQGGERVLTINNETYTVKDGVVTHNGQNYTITDGKANINGKEYEIPKSLENFIAGSETKVDFTAEVKPPKIRPFIGLGYTSKKPKGFGFEASLGAAFGKFGLKITNSPVLDDFEEFRKNKEDFKKDFDRYSSKFKVYPLAKLAVTYTF